MKCCSGGLLALELVDTKCKVSLIFSAPPPKKSQCLEGRAIVNHIEGWSP